jgi:Na+-transporting methylmalonyl-CoA/oxaloacetate decarboxylase beta subunit
LERSLENFWLNTGFANLEWGYFIMIIVGILFIYLGIKKNWEPLLLVPIGFGILVGNIPFVDGYQIGIYEKGSVLNTLYSGVITGWYPPLIFLGIGAMTDFSALISNPKLIFFWVQQLSWVFSLRLLELICWDSLPVNLEQLE